MPAVSPRCCRPVQGRDDRGRTARTRQVPDRPDDHPLWDPGIVRVLDPSPKARVVRSDMLRELRRLLDGDQAQQDLLGLVTVGQGGLSARDLAELTGIGVYEIERNLRTVTGRSFTSRAGYWQPGPGPRVYALGHVELQKEATLALGSTRLEGYRRRLHRWARDYRVQRWPATTPEYLLRGYYRLLLDTADISRLTACATDRPRHDRMLKITGGDATALTEITDFQDLLLRHEDYDLPVLARPNRRTGAPSPTATCTSPSACRQYGPPLDIRTAPKRWPGRSPTRTGGRRR